MKVSSHQQADSKSHLNPKKISPQSSQNNLSQRTLSQQLTMISPSTNKEREENRIELIKEHSRSVKHTHSVNIVKN